MEEREKDWQEEHGLGLKRAIRDEAPGSLLRVKHSLTPGPHQAPNKEAYRSPVRFESLSVEWAECGCQLEWCRDRGR